MSLYLRMMADAMDGIDRTKPAPYAWLITRDHLVERYGGEHSDVGTAGPSNAPDELLDKLRAGKRPAGSLVFRMYDDDGELYYDGVIAGDFEGLEPLDDYGTGGAGCTAIRYPGRPALNGP